MRNCAIVSAVSPDLLTTLKTVRGRSSRRERRSVPGRRSPTRRPACRRPRRAPGRARAPPSAEPPIADHHQRVEALAHLCRRLLHLLQVGPPVRQVGDRESARGPPLVQLPADTIQRRGRGRRARRRVTPSAPDRISRGGRSRRAGPSWPRATGGADGSACCGGRVARTPGAVKVALRESGPRPWQGRWPPGPPSRYPAPAKALAKIAADAARSVPRSLPRAAGAARRLHQRLLRPPASRPRALSRRRPALGDLLVVGLNDDASVRRLKGPGRPLLRLSRTRRGVGRPGGGRPRRRLLRGHAAPADRDPAPGRPGQGRRLGRRRDRRRRRRDRARRAGRAGRPSCPALDDRRSSAASARATDPAAPRLPGAPGHGTAPAPYGARM